MSKTFSISYMSFPVTVRVGDTLEVKMGLRTQTAPVEMIRYIYVNPTGDWQELIVAYDKPDGTRGAVRIMSNAGDSQFKALTEDLVQLKPNADLRGKPRREAFKTMGVRDAQVVAMVAIPVVIMLLLFVGLSPMIIHSFDKGSQKVSAGELATTKLSTSNLVLSGELDTERYLQITNTKNGVKTSAEYQFPVYPAGAADDAFVPVVLKTRELGDDAIDRLQQAGEWKCTLQNVLWEGLDSEDREYMANNLHLHVTKDTMLCELKEHENDLPGLAMVGILFCSGLFVSGIFVVAFLVARRRRR